VNYRSGAVKGMVPRVDPKERSEKLMDVRCERCKTEYEFDEARITEAGVTVKCTTCGHVFRVKKKSLVVTLPAPAEGNGNGGQKREWKLRQKGGGVTAFKELTTLQKWIVERKVTRDDEISLTGESWKKLGSIVELAPFFQIVEEADSKKNPEKPPNLLRPGSISPARESGPQAPPPLPDPAVRGGTQPEFAIRDDVPPTKVTPAPTGPSPAALAALGLVLVGLAGYFVYVYVWQPRTEQARLEREAEATAQKAREEAARAAAVPDASMAVAPPEPEPAPAPEDAGIVAEAVDAGPPAAPVPERDYDYFMKMADSLRDREKAHAALDAYGKAADMEPDRVEPVAGRALALLDLGRLPQAEKAFQQALRLNPRYAVAVMGLAETYRAQGRTDEAVAQYERYLEILPDGPESNVARNAIEKLRQ
jgi:predicted Zn finger-like uncharacterized protein